MSHRCFGKKNRTKKPKEKIKVDKRSRYRTASDNADHFPFKDLVCFSRFMKIREITQDAAKKKLLFAISWGGNNAGIIRNELLKRGWLEKFGPGQYCNNFGACAAVLQEPPDNENMVVSRLLANFPIRFLWCGGTINWAYVNPNTIVNRFPLGQTAFTTKTGLCRNLGQHHWIAKPGIAFVKYPRTFIIASPEDVQDFINQFRITACISMLRIFSEKGVRCVSNVGTIPTQMLDFAIKAVCDWVNFKENADLDVPDDHIVSEQIWDAFLFNFYELAQNNGAFNSATTYNLKELKNVCTTVLKTVHSNWPDMTSDGLQGAWVIKPAAQSCGRGIRVMKNLSTIVKHVAYRGPWVIQKYMEKPYLIHNTKFDIRQWFLVTSINPLIIWMYKDFYLRFASQLYSLENLDESVHLCNNSVQHKYRNSKDRNRELPKDNMWHCQRFKDYLKKMGHEEKWKQIIEGMEESIVGALLASQDQVFHRPNCFMLYGADFLLTEDLEPWLIEINSSPAMLPTTTVTEQLCAEALQDIIKVVIDRRDNPKAKTGKWSLLYRQRTMAPPLTYALMDVSLEAKKIWLPKPKAKKSKEKSKVSSSAIIRELQEKEDALEELGAIEVASPGKAPPFACESESMSSDHEWFSGHLRSLRYEQLAATYKDITSMDHRENLLQLTIATHLNEPPPEAPFGMSDSDFRNISQQSRDKIKTITNCLISLEAKIKAVQELNPPCIPSQSS